MSHITEINELAILDWDSCLKLAGNQPALAKDILTHIITHITNDLELIKQLYQAHKHAELIYEVHKLHGSLCYSGLPRLKMLIARLESQLKSNIMSDSSSLLHQLDTEVCLLLERIKDTDHAIAMAAI